MTVTSFSQLCGGNLGENIFLDGDFGSGEANILLTNPQIAPGYGYATSPPPVDGNYTIANNTGTWGDFASNWVNIGDNSDDPNGYMMVVNASFQPGLFYQKEIEGLCANTLYLFSVDVHNLLAAGAIKPNVSFLLDREIVFETGDVPTNEIWNTYGFTFTTGPEQTSISLALQNNAPGGSGNDLALDNISFRACGPQALLIPEELTRTCADGDPVNLTATIIGDEFANPSVQWQESLDEGQTWQDIFGETNLTYTFTNLLSGYYYFRFVVGDGTLNLSNPFCRIVSNNKIVYVAPLFYSIVDTLCEGLSFPLGDNFYNITGVYEDSLMTVYGCDSIVTLDLTIVGDTDVRGELISTDPSCVGEDNGIIIIDTLINGSEPYFIFINEELQSGQNIFDLADGEYNYHIEDNFGCFYDTTISLRDPEPFTIDVGADLFIDLGDAVIIDAFFSEPVNNTRWEALDNIFCDTLCERIELLPQNSMEIVLTAQTSDKGCLSWDSLKINVREVRKIYIPNAFSPNQDGINDYFTVLGSDPNVQLINNFSVYSRWGELVFQAKNFQLNDAQNKWDGTFKGEPTAAGIYIYSAEVLFLDGRVDLYKGDVTIIK